MSATLIIVGAGFEIVNHVSHALRICFETKYATSAKKRGDG
jgi:hypothetical protein